MLLGPYIWGHWEESFGYIGPPNVISLLRHNPIPWYSHGLSQMYLVAEDISIRISLTGSSLNVKDRKASKIQSDPSRRFRLKLSHLMHFR